MPILVHTVLGFDIRFDHCGTPSRRLGTSGIGWHSHKYADDQPQLGLILIFFYVNGFSPNDRALKVVSGSHHYRDLAISSNTNQQLCVGWVNNKKYSLTLQIHLCYFSMGYLSCAYEYDKVVLISITRGIVSYIKFCLIHNPLLNLLVRIHYDP